MDFNLTQEQKLLSESIQKFLAQRYSFEERRRILRTPAGTSPEVWGGLAELGLCSLSVPEAQGGMYPAPVETMLAMTALGRALCCEPFLSSAVIGTALIRGLGSADQKGTWLPQLAEGSLIAVPVHGEPGARHQLSCVETRAVRAGGGWTLRGHKAVALHAPAAGLLLVTARSSGGPGEEQGISLFAVPQGAAGLSRLDYPTFDGHRAAEVSLDGVQLPASALVGPEGGAFAALEAAFDEGVAALCAEAVGALQATLDATIDYTKTRKQFGVPIGKFQALQHRMAQMLIHVEQARSMATLAALRAQDPDPRRRRTAVSAAKVTVGRACRYVGQQAVQLHGGMGVSDELAVSHFFRRLSAIELSLGDTEHHLERFVAASRQEETR